MVMYSMRRHLLASTMCGGVALAAALVSQPAKAQESQVAASGDQIEEIVVTGSRIRRADTTTASPVTIIDAQALTDRGFIQVGQALNQMTSITPSLSMASGSGSAAGSGQQFPNLFGLGAGRTLSLVNGRRFVASSSGLGENTVDTNIIPTGLLKRIDIVQAGGAAVYGSDAIAGVVNYVLKDNFQGVELDAQTGISSRGDYPQHSLRGTVGRNFAEGRGNIAADVEWSKTKPLFDSDRPRSNLARVTVTNPANVTATDGISALTPLLDAHFWEFSNNGVIFTTPAPVAAFIFKNGGNNTQFSPTGELANYNTGTIAGVPFASGGEGESYRDLAALYTGLERFNVNAIGHYDINDHVKASGELLYAKTENTDPFASSASNTVLNSAASGFGPIQFSRTNGFLTPTALAALIAARPAFGAGQPLWLSKNWTDLLPTREGKTETETFRALAALDGDFNYADRDFYWSLSASRGVTEGSSRSWGVLNAKFANAINSVRNGAGQVVCAINADASATNDDTACAPLNPFGVGGVTDAARSYVTTQIGQDFKNTQDDLLATLGGDLFTLPAGAVKFSVAYEHRREEARFTPLAANQQGLTGSGTLSPATSGKYNTNEFSGEVLAPLVGGDFKLPLVKALDFSGAYRRVDNSIAGKENVWSAGLRWEVVTGVTLRGSRSRNFRAPTLNQLLSPSTTTLGSISVDPCDADRINGGPNPAVRRSNCQALFAAHPGYGPLATFQDGAENFSSVQITSGGNADLKNEVSDTTTVGFVLQPTFAPGLTIVADKIKVDLTDGLSLFTTQNFLATCFDSTTPSNEICGKFTRDAAGMVSTGVSQYFNAGSVRFRGETYNVNYSFPVGRFFEGRDLGTVELGVEATHVTLLETSVTGFDRTRTDDTTVQPEWTTRFDARYTKGPLHLSYSMFYLPEEPITRNDTIETNPNPVLKANVRHSISGAYDFGRYALRAGVSNLTDEEPSYPSRSYGDILGRQYYLGLRARF